MTMVENDVVVEVGGKPLTAAVERPCQHRGFSSSVVVADVLTLEGAHDHREARLRLRCSECGAPCEIEMSGRPPADGGPGVVLTFRPLDTNDQVPTGGPHAG